MTAPKLLTAALLGVTIGCTSGAAAATAAPRVGARATIHELSNNWAGYVVTAAKPFHRAVGSWVEPKVSCEGALHRYSAFWVGIGGFTKSAHALEQIGTEEDCAGGHTSSYAWYELLPAGEVTLKLSVHAGDHMAASVTVQGKAVALHLDDLTSGESFEKTLTMSSPDTSSAEWIAEAPSVCTSGNQRCRTLPLADFSSVTFTAASAAMGSGAGRPIDGQGLHVTEVSLQAGGVGFGFPGRAIASASSGQASPSALAQSGSSFTVTWEQASSPPPPFAYGLESFAGSGG
jgi:Peptidase A4 family